MSFVITPDSTPVYDGWGWGDYWGCLDWIEWHKQLLKKHSKDDSDFIWAKAWLAGLSTIGGGNGSAPGSNTLVDSVPIDCRTFNQTFRTYIQANEVLKSAVFSGVLGSTLGKVTSTTVGVAQDGLDTITNTTSGISKVIAFASKWVIAILIIAAVFFAYYLYIKFIKK